MQWLSSLILLTIAQICAAYPNPGTVTGNTAVHDPTMCKDDAGTYFVFSTAVGLEIRTSTDRTAWTLQGLVFPSGSSWAEKYTGSSNGNLWAPDCTYVDGQFLLYYAASTFGSQVSGIFFAKSSTGLPGSFTNEGLVTSTTTGSAFNAIDPNLIITGSTWYMSLGSFWEGIVGVSMPSSTGKTSSSTFTSLAERSGSDAMEASVIFKYGDYYYLFTSWDLCCQGTSSTYNIRVGRSKSLTGGYVDANGVALTSGGGTLVLETHGSIVGPGGQDLMTDNDGTVLVYHYYTSAGSFLGINLLDFSSGWPVAY